MTFMDVIHTYEAEAGGYMLLLKARIYFEA